MDNLIEPIRYTTSLFAIATAIAVMSALKGSSPERAPLIARIASVWLVIAGVLGALLSHLTRALPVPGLLPAGVALGLGLGFAASFSPTVAARFIALEDLQWRLLTLFRAVFGALLLASGASGLIPLGFALPAGLGDLLVGGLAVAVPGSLAAQGHRGYRLLVFGVGLLDFVSVVFLMVAVLVPWLSTTHSVGISLLLPWVAVPLLATLNFFGLRQVIKESSSAVATA